MPPPPAKSPRLAWPDAALAAAIFALALLTRLHFLHHAPDRAWPHSAWFQGDATVWADWASALACGELFERGLPIHTPGIAYLLHWLGYAAPANPQPGAAALTPTDFSGAKALWCLASALGCGLSYFAFRLEVRRRPAALAAGLLAFSFPSYLIATSLNGEALYALLIPLLVAGTILLARRPSLPLALAIGITHGLATLIRAEHTLLLLLLLAYTLWAQRGTLTKLRSARAPALRAAAATSLVLAASIAICLPWTIRSARATARFNTVPAQAIDYSHASPPWTPEARSLFETLPAFALHDNFAYLSFIAQKRGDRQITPDAIHAYFDTAFTDTKPGFKYWPEPLNARNLVCSQGPLCFALGNHPKSGGGFTKAGLETPLSDDPTLNLGYPPHLYLYNHGYRAGLDWIREDPARWLRLAGRKLLIFSGGVTQGLTAQNWPLGRTGARRAVDLFTARSPWTPAWRAILAALFLTGLIAAAKRRIGAAWLLVIAAKLITTVAFYGYARQAASILPAFFLFIALGLDTILCLAARALPTLRPRITTPGEPRRRPAALQFLWLAPAAALLVLDLRAGSPTLWPVFGPSGPPNPAPTASTPPPGKPYYWAAPRWGPSAFESVYDLDLAPRP